MVYAQIRNNIIKNTIILDDPSLESLFVVGFDSLERVDNLTPEPSQEWFKEDGVWNPPIIEDPTP